MTPQQREELSIYIRYAHLCGVPLSGEHSLKGTTLDVNHPLLQAFKRGLFEAPGVENKVDLVKASTFQLSFIFTNLYVS